MKTKYWNLFFVWQFGREEQWLNEMSQKGLQLKKVNGLHYTFEPGEPGGYIYRLELLDELPSHPDSKRYLDFLTGTGVEHIETMLRWVYLRKPAADGPFDLFSDIDSRIRHLQRVCTLLGVLVAIETSCLFAQLGALTHSGIWWGAALLGAIEVCLVCGFVSLYRQLKQLRKERQLHE